MLNNACEPELEELMGLNNAKYSQRITDAKQWQQRYSAILQLGRAIQEKPKLRASANQIQGCESKLWISATSKNQQWYFVVDSESRIIRGLAALLLLQINGCNWQHIQHFNAQDFLQKFGLDKHMSPSRNNGLLLLINHIQHIQ